MTKISQAEILGQIVEQVSEVISKKFDLQIKKEENRHSEEMFRLETDRSVRLAETERIKAETERIKAETEETKVRTEETKVRTKIKSKEL